MSMTDAPPGRPMDAFNLRQIVADLFDREAMPLIRHAVTVTFLACLAMSGAVAGVVAYVVAKAVRK